jgi:hypothetical protein
MDIQIIHEQINKCVEEYRYLFACGLIKETLPALDRDKLNDTAKIFYDHYNNIEV